MWIPFVLLCVMFALSKCSEDLLFSSIRNYLEGVSECACVRARLYVCVLVGGVCTGLTSQNKAFVYSSFRSNFAPSNMVVTSYRWLFTFRLTKN